MRKDDPGLNWAVDLLLSLRIEADDAPEEISRKLDLAAPALRFLGIERDKLLQVLFPPPGPQPTGQIMERIEALARRLGYDLDETVIQSPTPPVSFDEVEATIQNAIQEALAASGRPLPDDSALDEDWDDWEDLFADDRAPDPPREN